ncbi:hypothetical protein A2379_04220 [Candidatus Amesbacteria bacterium RIFOXYB1_FULL_47_13]|nr:MAG: hypothetical protein A2379_04220 [Candidatus Amesbacteria bacterium RIFOXYB1_FULL_47_13]
MFPLITRPDSMRRAFTMVELLIYLALMSIFLVIFGQIFFSVLDTQLKSRAVSAVQQDELYLLSRFGHDIRRATAVTSPASAGEISSSLAITVNSVNHTYGASSGSLTLTVDGVTSALTSSGTQLTGFSVTRLGDLNSKPSIRLDIVLTGRTTSFNQNLETRSLSTTFTLR